MDRDDHLINEALRDVFRAAADDLNMAQIAKPGEKQRRCKKGYFWCPVDKECKPEKKKKVVEDDLEHGRAHSLGSPGGPLNDKGGVKAYGERAEANPSSTNLAVHGGNSPWGNGPGFPGQTTSGANKFNILNAQDDDPYNPHPIKNAIYIEKEGDKYVFTRNGETLISTSSDKRLKEWASHYTAKGRGRFSAGKKIYPGKDVPL